MMAITNARPGSSTNLNDLQLKQASIVTSKECVINGTPGQCEKEVDRIPPTSLPSIVLALDFR